MFINRKGDPVLLPVGSIKPNPNQPRKKFENDQLDELCDSIREFGIIQPLIVKKADKDSYLLIAGERRLRAAIKIGMKNVPAIVRDASVEEAALIAIIENVQRSDLSYIEEANAYKRLMNEYSLTQTDIARKVGKQQSTISNKLRLLNLPEDIQLILSENRMSERHARALLRIDDDDLRRKVLQRILQNNLNVTQSEKLIKDILLKREKEVNSKERIRYINYKLYVNTLRKAFACINDAEKNAKFFQDEKDDYVEVRIVIPKNGKKQGNKIENIAIT
ncbi:MAG: ParB/RepB/Spo0J family partition protein [Firmicutes bacterium]|nr:ParB/RepB/Spo0J family partition protein [Bacillota bacterium]